jgi:hypothetical protein
LRALSAIRAPGREGYVVAVGSPKSPDAELSCLAVADFAREPELTAEGFLARHVPRLYGAGAAAEVTALLLAQTAVHESAAGLWELADGGWPAGSAPAAAEAAKSLAAQLALAKSALPKAGPDGNRRLDAVIPILDEYRIVCEAAAAGIREKAKLADFYERAGLPDDLYGYKKWK